jgi:hypothetical protein
MTSSRDYPYIRAWYAMTGSYEYYIRDRVEQARAEKAPSDAVYLLGDGTWATTDDILPADTRRQLGLEPLPMREPDIAEILMAVREGMYRSMHLRDLYGLDGIEEIDPATLLVRFSSGWNLKVHLELQAPSPSE